MARIEQKAKEYAKTFANKAMLPFIGGSIKRPLTPADIRKIIEMAYEGGWKSAAIYYGVPEED